MTNLYLTEQELAKKKKLSKNSKHWHLPHAQQGELELLLTGGYAPLKGYPTQQALQTILTEKQLPDGTFWPHPLALTISDNFAKQIKDDETITLCDTEGVAIALLTIEERWHVDNKKGINKDQWCSDKEQWHLAGRVEGIDPPHRYDFIVHRINQESAHTKRNETIAWITDTVMHKPQVTMLKQISKKHQKPIIIYTTSADANEVRPALSTRIRCYQHILKKLPKDTTLQILPINQTITDPNAALTLARVLQNFGHSHFVIDPNAYHTNTEYEAVKKQLNKYKKNLGIGQIMPEAQTKKPPEKYDTKTLKKDLKHDNPIPDWYSYEPVIKELKQDWKPAWKQGITLFLTGLSGAGKSTIANALKDKLEAYSGRKVTLLDGDIIRKHLSSELTFTKEHRDLNILRIGFVASEITKHGGIAICAPIAPYHETRDQVREMIEQKGKFVEIYVATPLDTCEKRDRKGLYAKARAGKIKGFTGIDAPYEKPKKPEITIDTTHVSKLEAARKIATYLRTQKYLVKNPS